MTSGPLLRACTTATRAQFPAARVLYDSLRHHHPDAELTVLLLDTGDALERDPSGFRLVSPREVGVPSDVLGRLAMACTAAELAGALTPWLVRFLVDEGAPAVVALGVDIEVFAPLHDVVELAVEHGIVLAPRLDAPVPDDGLEPTRAQVEAAGPFAAGFVAVGAAMHSLDDVFAPSARIGVAAIVPSHVLRDPGCAVSAWNLHSRELGVTGERFEVSGSPLRWFDFAGYSPKAPYLLSTEFERPRALLSRDSVLARLCDEHGARLRAAGYDERDLEYGYSVLPDGRVIDARMRRMYADTLDEAAALGEPEPPTPFGPAGAEPFVAWLDEPVAPPTDPRVSRYLARVWQEDETLQQAFPSLAGEGAEQYIGSLREAGAVDRGIPEWLLPTEEQLLELTKSRWRARPAGPQPRGINVVGYVTAVLGVGEVGRVLAATLDNARVPKVVVANPETASEKSLTFETCFASDAPYDTNLLCVNADHVRATAEQLGPEFFADRRTIGVWFWEVEDFPSSMTRAFDLVDEVWVASDFVLEAIGAAASKPVRKFALPVPVPSVPEGVTRSELGLPEDRFVFLFVYDYLSTAERKNPVGLIEAYTRAFGPDDGATLVLKSINGTKRVEQLERVRRAAAGRPDVIILDDYLSPEHHSALLAQCDAYVSLHRSEGFGLDMAKAMGLGKPVIATRYSGNLEFMDDATSYLVDYELQLIGPGCEPYPPDSKWAQPRLDHAAELMRRVVERPEEARERGGRAAERIRTDFSLGARSAALARMVDEARCRPAPRGSWRRFFMEGWRAHRDRVADLPYGAFDWLPDGTAIDATIRRLLIDGGDVVPDPEVDLDGFYAWLNTRVFPPKAPVVSRYLHRLWRDRPDFQSHFPGIDVDPRSYLEWLIEHGHADTDVPHRLLPTRDVLRELTRYQKRQARRDRLARAVRSAGQRAAGRRR
jgi:glycosyltransferase involved in cell wall biosynthesis